MDCDLDSLSKPPIFLLSDNSRRSNCTGRLHRSCFHQVGLGRGQDGWMWKQGTPCWRCRLWFYQPPPETPHPLGEAEGTEWMRVKPRDEMQPSPRWWFNEAEVRYAGRSLSACCGADAHLNNRKHERVVNTDKRVASTSVTCPLGAGTMLPASPLPPLPSPPRMHVKSD